MSEITDRAEEIRALAAQCEDLQELRRKLGWPMQSVLRAVEVLGLTTPLLRPDRMGKPRPAQAVPKPEAKGKK